MNQPPLLPARLSIPATRGQVPEPVWFHASCLMEALAAKRRDALYCGAIPNELHYETPRQSQLWQEVARRYAPDVEAAYCESFEPAIAWAAEGDPVHVVGLGAGGARKEAWLLEQLESPRFTPVDISAQLALLSARNTRPHLEEPPKPLAADLLQMPELPDWLGEIDGGQSRRLFTAFGLTPNSLPVALLPRLRDYLRPNDRLLVSANLIPGGTVEALRERVLPEYDNPETRAWIGQILIDWGIREWLTSPEFRVGRIEGYPALIAEAAWDHQVSLMWEGEPFSASTGQRLRLFFSIRFTPELFESALNEHGFRVVTRSLSACQREGIWMVEGVVS